MKDEATTLLVIVVFWTVLGVIGVISGGHIAIHHPYLSAAFVAVCVAVYFMSGEKK